MDKGIEVFLREFEKESDNILRDATKRVKNSIVRLTPVDEGEAVAEWDDGLNKSAQDIKREPDPKKRKTRARLQEKIDDMEMGDTYFLENHDPVAVRLDRGYSKKAPQGMTRLTARKWRGFVRGAGIAAQRRATKRVIDS